MKATRTIGFALAGALSLTTFACGSDGDDEPVDDGYTLLNSYDWTVPAGTEAGYCLRFTLEEELYIAGFEAIASEGTHHTVVTAANVGLPTGPDGLTECGSYDNNFDNMLFESSSGKDGYEFPEGVAIHVVPGQQVLINIHIVNATDFEMTGTTGTRIKKVEAEDVENIATQLFAGRVSLSVPPGVSTHTGYCESPGDVTVIGVIPHMHAHATHSKVVAMSSEMGETIIHDEDFDFDTTKNFRPVDPVPMAEGDMFEVHCTYDNNTNMNLPWGPDNNNNEMCFAGIYLYPASALTGTPLCGS